MPHLTPLLSHLTAVPTRTLRTLQGQLCQSPVDSFVSSSPQPWEQSMKTLRSTASRWHSERQKQNRTLRAKRLWQLLNLTRPAEEKTQDPMRVVILGDSKLQREFEARWQGRHVRGRRILVSNITSVQDLAKLQPALVYLGDGVQDRSRYLQATPRRALTVTAQTDSSACVTLKSSRLSNGKEVLRPYPNYSRLRSQQLIIHPSAVRVLPKNP